MAPCVAHLLERLEGDDDAPEDASESNRNTKVATKVGTQGIQVDTASSSWAAPNVNKQSAEATNLESSPERAQTRKDPSSSTDKRRKRKRKSKATNHTPVGTTNNSTGTIGATDEQYYECQDYKLRRRRIICTLRRRLSYLLLTNTIRRLLRK